MLPRRPRRPRPRPAARRRRLRPAAGPAPATDQERRGRFTPQIPRRRPAGLAAAGHHDLGAGPGARRRQRRIRLAAGRAGPDPAGVAARGPAGVAPRTGPGCRHPGRRAAGHGCLRREHLWPVAVAAVGPAAVQHPHRQEHLQLGQAGLGHAVLQQRQRLPRGGAGAVPARWQLDHRLRHRHAQWRSGLPSGRRAHQRLRADHTQPDLRLLPDRADGRAASAADDGGRGAEVHHLDGHGGAPAAPCQPLRAGRCGHARSRRRATKLAGLGAPAGVQS
mmetsp:Transcript_59429/g.140491  ORF Transcript_59429/g.140491 Transcript_59429/m.140491 type:complete len:277 (+) Transcript_59429:2176-3006(+)